MYNSSTSTQHRNFSFTQSCHMTWFCVSQLESILWCKGLSTNLQQWSTNDNHFFLIHQSHLKSEDTHDAPTRKGVNIIPLTCSMCCWGEWLQILSITTSCKNYFLLPTHITMTKWQKLIANKGTLSTFTHVLLPILTSSELHTPTNKGSAGHW